MAAFFWFVYAYIKNGAIIERSPSLIEKRRGGKRTNYFGNNMRKNEMRIVLMHMHNQQWLGDATHIKSHQTAYTRIQNARSADF